MGRYLLFFTYIGRNFCGLAKQKRVRTVVQSLEGALENLCSNNETINVVPSSRTDKGVHALCNTAHVDLQTRLEGWEFHPEIVTIAMNQWLSRHEEEVRVIKTIRVPKNFHSRFCAKGRTYVYRISCLNTENHSQHEKWKHPLIPMETVLPSGPINMKIVKEAADILEGEHDFTAFTPPSHLEPHQNPVKKLKVEVARSSAIMNEHVGEYYKERYTHWDLIFHGSSFLYHQVRNMTGILLGAGRGYISLDSVTNMLINPSSQPQELKKYNHIFTIPAYGLLLKDVHYDENDFVITEEEEKNMKLYHPLKDIQAYEQIVKKQLKKLLKKGDTGKFYNQDIYNPHHKITKKIYDKIKQEQEECYITKTKS